MTGGALERLVELRTATERRRADFEAADGAARAAALQRLHLALELRWKLEEQVVIPALGPAAAAQMLPLAEREANRLRELLTLAKADAVAAPLGAAVLAAVTALAAVRSERIEAALARAERRKGFAQAALLRHIDEMLQRWHVEVQHTGDIEDEELDPVGLPPR